MAKPSEMTVDPAVRPAPRASARLKLATAGILILALYVITRPYLGLIHDARLYAVQAVNVWRPAALASDLYFRYGSQDGFSAYTAIYAPLVAALGVQGADLAAEMLGQILWLGSAAALAFGLFNKPREAIAALVGVILLRSSYGGEGIFQYAEPFATPRLFAEALALTAFSLALKRRRVLSALLIAVAGALHPLTALGAAGVILIAWAFTDRRAWMLIGAGAVIASLAIAFRIGPFARAWETFDPQWLAIVRRRCSFAFVGEWRWWDLWLAGAQISALCVAWRIASALERRLIAAVLTVTLAGLIVSLMGADAMRNVLIVNLQVWRVLWIAAVAANAFLAIIAVRLPRGACSWEFLAFALGSSALVRWLPESRVLEPFVLMLALAIVAAELSRGHRLGAPARAIAGIAFATAAVVFAWMLWYHLGHGFRVGRDMVELALAGAVFGLLWLQGRAFDSRMIAGAAALMLVGGAALADNQDDWNRFAVSPRVDPSLRAFVPVSGNIYWEGESGLLVLWFKLRQPDYYSCLQGSGAMFYRRTALDYDRRGSVLRGLNGADFVGGVGTLCDTKVDMTAVDPQGPSQVEGACRALPDLDTLILNRPVPGLKAVASWRAPTYLEGRLKDGSHVRLNTFYRYDCRPLRDQPPN
ncbi:MAG TPA: hypothetical protein VIC25_02205 [Caulobacteraceae bacterium]